MLLLDYWQGEYRDDYLYETGVIADIMAPRLIDTTRCCQHRVLLLVPHVVAGIAWVAGIVRCCWHRTMLLIPHVVAGTARRRWYRVLLLASRVTVCYRDRPLLLASRI